MYKPVVFVVFALFLCVATSCGESTSNESNTTEPMRNAEGLPSQMIIETTLGAITCELFPDQAPMTVDIIAGLAEGSREWTHPETSQTMTGTPYYDGIIFHRVIPNFMIQTGDPTGTGTRGPGFQFNDEFSPDLRFDQPGRLAMANRGPNTNGGQFFITVAPTPHLDGRHTIFGQVVEGQDVAVAISEVATANDRPQEEVRIIRARIARGSGD